MLSLNRCGREMSFMFRRFFFRRRACVDPTFAAIVANPVHGGVVDHGGVVNVVDVRDTHVVHGAVVEKLSVVPSSAFIPMAEVAESVNDSAIEADVWTPKALMENKYAATPTPPGRGPEE